MGSCSGQAFIQSMGERTIGATVKETCVLLGIPEEGFSSHSWRRSSTTSLADAGASFGDLKRAGRWRSASVVEGYTYRAVLKTKIARTLTAAVTSTPRVPVTAEMILPPVPVRQLPPTVPSGQLPAPSVGQNLIQVAAPAGQIQWWNGVSGDSQNFQVQADPALNAAPPLLFHGCTFNGPVVVKINKIKVFK